MFEYEVQVFMRICGKESVRMARFVHYYDAIMWRDFVTIKYCSVNTVVTSVKIIDLETGAEC